MRGADTFTESLFTLRKLEDFVPTAHPLRAIRTMANAALVKMNGLFSRMYEADVKGGRPSIAAIVNVVVVSLHANCFNSGV
jgi:hypothetical protein